MKSLSEPQKLKEYYQQKSVSKEYISRRFKSALGLYQHKNQVKFLNRFLSENNIKKILEIAPGPARITQYLTNFEAGTVLEYSQPMLNIAQQKLKEKNLLNKWTLIQGDVFRPPKILPSFDLIYSFRFLRHFKLDRRKQLYSFILRHLKKSSYFLFEAPNYQIESKFRKLIGEHKFPIYDKLWKQKELRKELKSAGFKVISFTGNLHHFYLAFLISEITKRTYLTSLGLSLINLIETLFPFGKPYEWLVLCQKK